MIRSGELAMGQRLKQLHVARHLGASQTPVREAIRTLEQEGWLISEFGRGTRVRQLSLQEIDEIYEMRELLEGFMARKAAVLLTESQIDQLRELAVAADNAEEKDSFTADAPSSDDLNFHLALARLVGNGILLDFYHRLCNLGLLLVALSVKHMPRAVSTPHGDLVDAIQSRQPDWAEAVARRLLRLARDRVREAVARGLPAFRVTSDGRHKVADRTASGLPPRTTRGRKARE
jgi:DNA-binding GntR family transcriptional regulator